ncbi:MAG: hypothetical protein Fur0024_0260 [Patescibacteria group bacterium]
MHKAKAVVITCIDFRFHDQVQSFLKEKGYLGHSDEIVIAGSSRDFVKPLEEFHGNYVWRQVELSMKLHDPDEIVVIDHQDCGGYAQDGTIPAGLSKEEDKNHHKNHLEKLKSDLEAKYAGKVVKFFYATLEGNVEEVIV